MQDSCETGGDRSVGPSAAFVTISWALSVPALLDLAPNTPPDENPT